MIELKCDFDSTDALKALYFRDISGVKSVS
jgi:hypothetical protein